MLIINVSKYFLVKFQWRSSLYSASSHNEKGTKLTTGHAASDMNFIHLQLCTTFEFRYEAHGKPEML
jgi:hypothetical protein